MKSIEIGAWRLSPDDGSLSRGDTVKRLQPKVMDVLLALAARPGEVISRDELLQAVWGERAVSDEPLTRCIAELRSAFDDKASAPEYIETLPKRGYRLIAPVATTEPGPTLPMATKTDRRWLPVAAVTAVMIALVALWLFRPEPPSDEGDFESPGKAAEDAEHRAVPPVDDPSIAVLAFSDLSPEGDQAWFSDGIAEEVLNLLSSVPELRVTSRSSSFSYKNKDMRVSEIAAELGVGYVLEGSVRKDEDQLRVTAQLIDGATDSHVWSKTWDRTFDDVFAIQEEIATDVAETLHVALVRQLPRIRQTDPAAYALYLKALDRAREFSEDGIRASDALLREALAIDPNYVPALMSLGINAVNSAGLGLISNEEMAARAQEAATRTLEIEPEFAPAHSMLGWLSRRDKDLQTAARHYERALAIDPTDVNTLNGSAMLLTALDRLDDTLALNDAMLRRNPVSVAAHYNRGHTLARMGRHNEAIEALRKALRMNPDQGAAHYSIGTSLLLLEEPEGALAEFEHEQVEIWRLLGLPMAYHALGREDEEQAALAELVDKYGEHAAYNIGYVHAFRGEADLAFEWLEREYEASGGGVPLIAVEPLFENIHDDPRWPAFLRKIGKSPEQLEAVEFEVTLPD